MKIRLETQFRDVEKALDKVDGAVLTATQRGISLGVRKARTLAKRHAAKDFKITQRKVTKKRIVEAVLPKKQDRLKMWGSVWFNHYRESMSEEKGYTLTDARNPNAAPRPGVSVKGQPFTINPKNNRYNLFVKRDPKRRVNTNRYRIVKNKKGQITKGSLYNSAFNSSAVHVLYYRRAVADAKNLAIKISKTVKPLALKEYARVLELKLKKAGL